MDEAKFIKEFMALTSCSESTARSVYIHAEALQAGEAQAEPAAEESGEAAAPRPSSEASPKAD